jgi:hypothetical protein
VPSTLYLFDLLYLNRYDIRQVSLRYRKQVLRNAFDFLGSLRFTEPLETEGAKQCRSQHIEATEFLRKRPNQLVRRGSRSRICVVQQHDGSRLHYDFQQAVNGVLASWAVFN